MAWSVWRMVNGKLESFERGNTIFVRKSNFPERVIELTQLLTGKQYYEGNNNTVNVDVVAVYRSAFGTKILTGFNVTYRGEN